MGGNIECNIPRLFYSLRVVVARLEVLPPLEGLDLLGALQAPEGAVLPEEGRLPGEEDDDVEEVLPVVAEGVGGHVRGEVKVRPGDHVEELAVVAQHLQPRSELCAPLQYVLFRMRLRAGYMVSIPDITNFLSVTCLRSRICLAGDPCFHVACRRIFTPYTIFAVGRGCSRT